jgi:hypothetical protein
MLVAASAGATAVGAAGAGAEKGITNIAVAAPHRQ